MKSHMFLFSLSLFAILISSCEKNNPVNSDNRSEIIPLKMGNAWVSTLSNYDSNGAVTGAYVESVWVARDTVINGQSYFLIFHQLENSVGPPFPQITTYLARNTPSGYSERNLELNVEGIIYRYPYQAGDSMVISSNENITVPAGTFDCTVYKFAAGATRVDTLLQILYGKSYISPNVGIIKKEFWYPQNRLLYRSVLSQVFLNQK